MTRNAMLLLALYALVQIKPTMSAPVLNAANAPVPIQNDNALQLLLHHNEGNENEVIWRNKLTNLEKHARKPRHAVQAEVPEPSKCSFEIISEIFYQSTPVSCPLLKVLAQYSKKKDKAELGYIVDPLANAVNATANLAFAFVNYAIPLKMKCVMWYNVSCFTYRHVLPCDLATNFSKPVTGTEVCAMCGNRVSRDPARFVVGLAMAIVVFVLVMLRMFYQLLCYRCLHRRSETNVVVTFTDERDFDAIMEKEYKSMFEVIKNAKL